MHAKQVRFSHCGRCSENAASARMLSLVSPTYYILPTVHRPCTSNNSLYQRARHAPAWSGVHVTIGLLALSCSLVFCNRQRFCMGSSSASSATGDSSNSLEGLPNEVLRPFMRWLFASVHFDFTTIGACIPNTTVPLHQALISFTQALNSSYVFTASQSTDALLKISGKEGGFT